MMQSVMQTSTPYTIPTLTSTTVPIMKSSFVKTLRRVTLMLLILLCPALVAAQSAQDLPFNYGFETPLASEGWTLINPDQDGEGNHYIKAEIGTTIVHSGVKSFVFTTGAASGHTAYLISPKLSITEASRMLFYFRKLANDHSGAFSIGTSTDDNIDVFNAEHFNFAAEINTTTTEYASYNFALTNTAVTYVAFKFESHSEGDTMSLILDDIRFSPKCDEPTSFRYTSITMRSVSLEWTDNTEGEASYEVKNGDALVASVAAGETSCVVNDLEPNTEYTFTLHTICGETPRYQHTLTFKTVTGPVVEGYVCGGGRMADVNGSSRVTVVNSGHLYAVYGGNDIAGEVKAQTSHYGEEYDAYKGAEVIVGTDKTEQVLIDYVYGGGSGLYHYPGIGTNSTSINGTSNIQEITYVDGTPLDPRDNGNPLNPNNPNSKYNRFVNQDTVLNDINQNGNVCGYYGTDNGYSESFDNYNRNLIYATISADEDGNYPTLPKVAHTRIFVNSDNVYIDSLFGGAENTIVGNDVANLSAPADTTVSITINAGTIYSLYGGNNYGGFLGKGTYQHIVVNDTKKNSASSINLGGDFATGKSHTRSGSNPENYTYALQTGAHGIRYLFGGGNDVMARNVHVEIKGGQIDTLFAGGNSADVASTTVEVKVTSPLYYDVDMPHSTYESASLDPYSPEESVFDIRCLFGGNNMAHMYCLPELNLTKGGIHTLYGGGNRGLMLAKDPYTDNDDQSAYRSTKIVLDNIHIVCDTVYGGGQSAGTIHDTYIKFTKGYVGTMFGGTNITGDIGHQGASTGRYLSGTVYKPYAKTNILIDDYRAEINEALFGGSNGFFLCTDNDKYVNEQLFTSDVVDYSGLANTLLPHVWETNILITDATIEGNIYGGGNMAPVGTLDVNYQNESAIRATTEGNTYLRINGGTFWEYREDEGSPWDYYYWPNAAFGGCNYANVYGNTNVLVSGDPEFHGNLYGGNDKTGTVTGGPSRDGYSSESTLEVVWDAIPDVLQADGTRNMQLLSSNAASLVKLEGSPKFGDWFSVFGGGNGDYNYFSIDDEDTTHLDPWMLLPEWHFEERPEAVRCSYLPLPNVRSSFVDINIDEEGVLYQVFGGGNYATVGDAVSINNGSHLIPDGKATVWFNCTDLSSDHNAMSIFGGNNQTSMNIVPSVYLLKGVVNNVYGGGNQGDMKGYRNFGGDFEFNTGTCVVLASPDVEVMENIYGGCNAADVDTATLVMVYKGDVSGNIFGGNNISGDSRNTHIYIEGENDGDITINGEVFGGCNGNYHYTSETEAPYTNLFWTSDEDGNMYERLRGRPYADSTSIVVKGDVTINGNIYGGGLAGDCRVTDVDIDAPNGVFNCMIFGGGKGDVDEIGNACSEYTGYADGNTRKHVGNIVGDDAGTNVHIKQMKNMNLSSGKRHAVFGGGFAGDVNGNTNVILYNTNTATIPAVYLGGIAGDVTGTATGLFDGITPSDPNANIVDTIYGGNDFTGRVYATDITINSGVYQHVFGGGNGDYTYKDIMSLTSAPSYSQERAGFSSTPGADGRYWKFGDGTCTAKIDTVPYSMKVNAVFNGGTFRGNVYGGGNLGLVGNRDMVPGDMEATDADHYANLGTIHVTINDGEFKRHVYGGARGRSRLKDRFFGTANSSIANVDGSPLGRHLVYGLKQIDMYGGNIFFSLHGGSESVDDGYPFECIGPVESATNYYKNLADRVKYGTEQGYADPGSTLRPSSIVNIIGGHVRKSVYGGGYQGNIYGSVYVNVGAQAVNDSPVWTKFANMRVDDIVDNTISDFKPTNLTIENPIQLDASIYNCADWGEAGDKAYFNTRGVFGGETDVIIDGEGYNTSGNPLVSSSEPEMNIAVSVIGAGTSTEGGDINRLIVMRNYGSYLCPKPLKSLYSIQRADKVLLDNVYINLFGEQDAFESYASPNFSLNRIDTLALCNDNVLNIESPANFIGLHASMKGINDVYHLYNIDGSSPNLVTNTAVSGIAQAEQNLASNDILDNQVGPGDCSGNTNVCDLMDVCALVPTNRGDRGRPGKFNTIIVDEGSYFKVSPFVDISDVRSGSSVSGRDGVDDNDDALSTNDHIYGHVFGYTYLVAPLETMGYVYGDYKIGSHNTTDGGFVSPCTCNNIDTNVNPEIGYTNVTTTGPYRTWKIGTANGLRKRSATLIANKEPDNILNWSLSDATPYATTISGSTEYDLPGSNFAYATTAIELPPAQKGNFYIVESIDIDQANGGEMHLVDEGYEAITHTVFQAPSLATDQGLSSIDHGDEEVHNITFGLTMSGVAPTNGGRVTNFASYDNCWLTNSTLTGVTTADGPTTRSFNRDEDHCWPITAISGSTYFTSIGGFLSNAVQSANGAVDGILPRINLTLTYDKRISNTISRDVKFRMLEYDSTGHYIGPIDVTVTINTVIRNFSDIEAPVLAMYNEGINNEYVRRVNIPASFMQRDLYLEDIKWERNTAISEDHFHLQDMDDTITTKTQFAIQVSPVEMVSNTLNNHLGWYDIVEENRNIDLYATALDDLKRRTGESSTVFSDAQSVNYTSWNIDATAPTAATPTPKYKVTTSTNKYDWGSVTGAGSYDEGAEVTLTATANEGYTFVNWSDGVTTATRNYTANADASFIANFRSNNDNTTYTVSVSANDDAFGSVSVGAGPWYKDSKVTVVATPSSNYHFVKWSNNNTENPYVLTVGEENISLTAEFAIDKHIITANVNNNSYGSVSGAGSYDHDAEATLTASANSGYEFVNWSDGVTDVSRSYTAIADASFTANFKATDNTTILNVAVTPVTALSGATAGSVTVPTGDWYEGSKVDISATPEDGFTFTYWSDGSTDNPHQITVGNTNLNIVASFVNETLEEHYNGTMPSYGHVIEHEDNTWGDDQKAEWYDDRISTTSLHGKEGIKLGTLDGRAPATLDVTLKYNGNLVYNDHFKDSDPGPLAWAYLKLHWYNNNTEDATGPDDGIFWVKVKLRTREKGDTIYMAPGTTLTRNTTEGTPCTVNYWLNSPEREPALTLLDQNADDIRNNPNMYVNTFKEALSIFQEGDVLDIMETIEIGEGNPLTVDAPLNMGSDNHVGIQVIRYSGSHFKFPSLGCANPNVMVKVSNGGRIAFRNVQFNGSGATRVKKRQDNFASENTNTYTHSGSYYYNESGDRVKAIYFANAPIMQCDGSGQLSLNDKVSLINNFNKASNSSSGFVGGGALAVTNGGIVTLGDNTVIRDNMVVEHASVDNYGGAVYVDGGVLRVGPNIEDGDCKINITNNYYYKPEASVLDGVVDGANDNAPGGFIAEKKMVDPTELPNYPFYWVYKLNTKPRASLKDTFSLSNVYLKRTPSSIVPTSSNATEVAGILKVRDDAKGDRIQFTGALSEGSRIGVSKWFPGYRYYSNTITQNTDPTGEGYHKLYNTVPRDTVSIAVLNGSTKGVLAERNYSNDVFFNDSNYFAQSSGTLSFATDNNYTSYHADAITNPSYNDQVSTFYHSYLDEKTIYLHRCGSFGKGVSKRQLTYETASNPNAKLDDFQFGDSIAFRMNPDATCEVISDTLVFKVGGGFFPYTYHWDYDSVLGGTFAAPVLYRKDIRERQTYDPNSISNFAVESYAAKRFAAERDTLVLYDLEERQTELQSTYFFQVTAKDITGCAVTQPIMVRVAKNHDSENIVDNGNFLLYGNTYVVPSSVDSSDFHGHAGDYQGNTGLSTINASYKLLDGGSWITDPDAALYASYSGDKTPRYMRTYRTFKVTPFVMPSMADAVIDVRAYTNAGGTELNLNENFFCPGSMIYLTPRKTADDSSKWEYMSWDFDPSSGRNTTFVVGNDAESNKPTVYYSPSDYWWQVVNTYENVAEESENDSVATQYDYYTDYYGDVTIKTKKGLAWLISRVNGYNGQSARTFHFNTITIDPSLADDVLDMQEHKWTPLGNQSNPFEGVFVGNDRVISNIIVNEPVLPLVGMFGYTDSADISNLTVSKVQLRGNSYIGSLVAHSHASKILNVDVPDGVIFSEFVVGGLIGKDESTYVDRVEISDEQDSPTHGKSGDVNARPLQVKCNAIYFGGICGQSYNSTIRNSVVNEINQKYLSALYSGPIVGSSEAPSKRKARKSGLHTTVENCYAHIRSTGNAERLGGLVGRAESIDMSNCYVYGEAKATEFTGALAGYVGSNVSIDRCYYVDGLSEGVVGSGFSSSVQNSTTFHGSGTQVLMTDRVDGYNNLLRTLNGWVNRQEDTTYLHWRPAVGIENGGYPLFGDQVMIEVFDTINVAACDSYDFDGITLTQSGSYVMHIVDEADYLDSTVTLLLTVNYGESVEVSDTVLLGQPYEGYGISLTAEQVSAAYGNDHSVDISTMIYVDSLLSANGCDSLIILTLYIVNENVDINSQISTLSAEVKIYPNPTRSMVTVEGSELLSVEVYDNISRRILTRTSDGKENIIRFDMSQQAAGSYYIRVKTAHGTVVKKLIKK